MKKTLTDRAYDWQDAEAARPRGAHNVSPIEAWKAGYRAAKRDAARKPVKRAARP